MTDLAELLERVRSATGPDRELDHRCEAAFRIFMGMSNWGVSKNAVEWLANSVGRDTGVPKYTSSIDTCLTAVSILLPEAWVDLNLSNGHAEAKVCFESNRAYWSDEGHPTAPLAILSATLSALIAQAQP